MIHIAFEGIYNCRSKGKDAFDKGVRILIWLSISMHGLCTTYLSGEKRKYFVLLFSESSIW